MTNQSRKIKLSDVARKHIRILSYLLVSGVLGWVLAAYVADNEALTAVFAPAINYAIYALKKELNSEGVNQAMKDRK